MQPLFSHRRTERLDISGSARHDGFGLEISHTRLPLKLRVGIGDPGSVGSMVMLFEMWLPSAVLAFLAYSYLGPTGAPWWQTVIAWFGAYLLYGGAKDILQIAANAPFQPRVQWQWHACEHKAAVVLESDLDPTEENVRRANPVMPRCGTVQLVTGALTSITLGIWLMHFSWWWYPVFLSCVTAERSVRPQERRNRRRPNMFFELLGAPPLMLALALERLLVIRTPTAQQIEATVVLLNIAYRTSRWVQPPRLRNRRRPHR